MFTPAIAGNAEPSSGLLLHKLGSYTSMTSGVILNAHIIVGVTYLQDAMR